MGDPRLIPLSEAAKAKADYIALGTSGLALFKAIPWPEIAACLASIYWLFRIGESVFGWFRKKRRK